MSMKPILIFHILEDTWIFFGAYWVGVNLLKRDSDAGVARSRKGLRTAFLGMTLLLLYLGRHIIPPLIIVVLSIAWAALGLYWTATGSDAHSLEFRFYRWIRLLILAVVFLLLFWNRTGIGVLGEYFLPQSIPSALAGFIAALAGLAIAVWARVSLGRFWSDKVVLQSDHHLIRSGPYARMRHPIYSGVLLAVLGTAIAGGEWRGLLAFAILCANYQIKARREEALLAKEFDGFTEHLKATGFFFPRFRRL